MPIQPRAEYRGAKAHRVLVTRPLSHFQEFGRGSRSYYNGRWDSVALNPVRKRLVVAATSGANVRKALAH